MPNYISFMYISGHWNFQYCWLQTCHLQKGCWWRILLSRLGDCTRVVHNGYFFITYSTTSCLQHLSSKSRCILECKYVLECNPYCDHDCNNCLLKFCIVIKYYFQKLVLSFKSTIQHCPCGCDVGLDENYEAHANSQFSLIGECSTQDMKMKTDI